MEVVFLIAGTILFMFGLMKALFGDNNNKTLKFELSLIVMFVGVIIFHIGTDDKKQDIKEYHCYVKKVLVDDKIISVDTIYWTIEK